MESFLPIFQEEKENQMSSKTKEIIAALPKADWWGADSKLYQYEGFWHYLPFLEGLISAQGQFNPQPSDIVVCSSTKTGTTWLKALTFAVVTRHRFSDSTNPLLSKVPHDCIPFLEIDLAHNSSNRDPQIPLISTHVPYTSLPKSIEASGCKIVYICRDPKDVFVSKWHFFSKLLPEPLPLKEAFELFCDGVSLYGPFWDHVLGYWRAKLESPEKVMFLKYEELKRDTAFYVRKLAEFMGYPFSLEEEEKKVVQRIIEMCSFEELSNLEVNKTGKHREDTEFTVENNKYFRKGKVGDWRNHLNAEMVARIDQITEHKLSGYGLTLFST